MMQQLSTLSNAQSRSISPENFTGAKGKGGMAESGTGASCARDLGQGWKVSPSVVVEAGTTFEIAALQRGLYDSRWSRRPWALCGYLYGLGRQ